MQRLILLVVFVLLSGCGGDGSANAPILHLRIDGASGSSAGQHRIERTGVISESGDGPAGGAVTSSQTVTVDKITDDGIAVTVTQFDSDAGEFSKQFFVPYDKEVTIAISDDTAATARLEHKE